MGTFTFNGVTVVAPQVLVKTAIGQQLALQLLPNGVICFLGAADGGEGSGAYYNFNDTNAPKTLLRSGPLLDAILNAAQLGASAGFVACVVNSKTQASYTLTGAGPISATITSGDYGAWNNLITVQTSTGTNAGTFCFTLTYPDAYGNTNVVGGLKSSFDNLADLNGLAAAITNNSLLTPPAATNLPPIISIEVTSNGAPTNTMGAVNLAGGTGAGTDTITLEEVTEGIDELQDVPFDIGHIVGGYNPDMWAYADEKGAQALETFGNLRRWIHQFVPTGVSPNQNKIQNSEALANSGIGAAAGLNSKRSSVIGQKIKNYNPSTGLSTFTDAAPLICGLASYQGATDQWGPSSPLTKVAIPTAIDLDYVCLVTTGDVDRAILGGVWLLERVGRVPGLGGVRSVQSVTTAPTDSTGAPWPFAEFSIVRGSDAVLANVKGAIEGQSPRAIGGGNTPKAMASIISDVVNVLELAKDNNWINSYDKTSISIATIGTGGDADSVQYSIVPVPPLNHIGITQTLLPFTASLAASGAVSSS